MSPAPTTPTDRTSRGTAGESAPGDGRPRALGTPADVLRPDLLGDVYRHPVEVLVHPRTGDLVVLPDRTTPEDPR